MPRGWRTEPRAHLLLALGARAVPQLLAALDQHHRRLHAPALRPLRARGPRDKRQGMAGDSGRTARRAGDARTCKRATGSARARGARARARGARAAARTSLLSPRPSRATAASVLRGPPAAPPLPPPDPPVVRARTFVAPPASYHAFTCGRERGMFRRAGGLRCETAGEVEGGGEGARLGSAGPAALYGTVKTCSRQLPSATHDGCRCGTRAEGRRRRGRTFGARSCCGWRKTSPSKLLLIERPFQLLSRAPFATMTSPGLPAARTPGEAHSRRGGRGRGFAGQRAGEEKGGC